MSFPLRTPGLLTLGLFLLFGGLSLWQSRRAPIGDFGNYYYATRFWLEGEFDRGIYEPFVFNERVASVSAERLYLNYTPVPPLSVLVYTPFVMVGKVHLAKSIFGLLGLVLFLFTFHRAVTFLKLEDNPSLLVLPVIFFIPFRNNFWQGQSYLFLTAFLLEGILQWKKQRTLVAGILWALPMALKIYPAILLLFPLIKGERKWLVITIVAAGIFSLLPALVLPDGVTVHYFTEILPRLEEGDINFHFAVLFQSAKVLIDRLLVYDSQLNTHPVANCPVLATWFHSIFQWMILVPGIGFLLNKKVNDWLLIGITMLAGVLISGYGSTYSLVILLPLALGWIVSFTDEKADQYTSVKYAALFCLLLACNIPVNNLLDQPTGLQFPRLYLFILLFITTAWVFRVQMKVLHIWAGVLAILIIIKTSVQLHTRVIPPPYYLSETNYGIIYGYVKKDSLLTLTVFDQTGTHSEEIKTTDSIFIDKRLQEIDNQIIFQNKVLTHERTRALHPMRLNSNEILYLSDEGRGVGFYTLRKMSLPNVLQN